MAFDLSTAKPVAKGGFDLATAKPAKAEESGGFIQGAGNLAAGLIRGTGSIGATILTPYDMAVGNTQSWGNPERRAGMDGGLQEMGAQPDSWMYKGGKLVGEIAGTAGGGGLVAKGLTTAAPAAVSNAPRVAQLLEALKSGGFTLGSKSATLGGRVGDLGIRAAGGSAAGASQAGLIDPTEAGMGAMIGGALPVGVQAVGGAAGAVGNAVRFVKKPPETHLANKLAQSLGMTPTELVGALQPGPMPLNNLPGYAATVPQILQNPVSSQLQRTLKTAGANALGDAERVQQGAYRTALEGVAPIDISVQDAANRAGGAIQGYAIPARGEATQRVRDAFEAVDPFNESALHLPIKEMQAQQGKYLGEGTFGTGGKASEAIATAQRVGTLEIPAVAPLARESASNSQTLEKAVRSAGGIRGGSGELRDLGIRQSGTTGLVNNKTGKSADLLAEEMYRRGYIADADPATLMDALRNGGGRNVFANDQVESNVMQRMSEAAMGDAPGATTISKAVPFQTVQNLRSSMGEAADVARAKGANKEAAALEKMVGEVDSRINRAAGGSVGEGEFFPKEMADQYREALRLHADKMSKFETGPQMGMFRRGGDGQASIQGAEIPGKFYSGRRSQVEDVQSLKRLLGDQSALMDEMKRYAVTEGAGTSNVAGDLTSKFSKWLQSRSGANAELFSAKQNATLKEVGKAVERGINAENLGRVSGSDTAQKLEALNNLGLLDSKTVSVLATRIPIVGSFTGPMLSSLKETAGQTRNNALSKMLASPDDLAKALKPGTSQSNALLEWMNRSGSAGSKVIYPLVGGGGQ